MDTNGNLVSKLHGEIVLTSPQVTQNTLENIANDWINRQTNNFWPPNILASDISRNLNLYYVPHLVISGRGSAIWSASIGEDYEEKKPCSQCGGTGTTMGGAVWGKEKPMRCPWCNGRGYNSETHTKWRSQSGVANGQVDKIIQNSNLDIRCGKRRNILASSVTSTALKELTITDPTHSSLTSLNGIAKDLVKKSIESDVTQKTHRLGRVRDLSINMPSFESLDIQHWLYPIYFGEYTYQDEILAVQIDGVTGQIWADLPQQVKSQRLKRNITFGAIGIFIISIALILAISHYNLPSDVSGTWDGELTHHVAINSDQDYAYTMDITQENDQITGISTITYRKSIFVRYTGTIRFAGTVSRDTVTFEDIEVLESNAPTDDYWCLKKGVLKLTDSSLSGSWSGLTACYRGGRINLSR